MAFGNQFLTEPALFPARCAGLPAGEARLAVELPGGPYLLEGLSAGQHAALARRYGERCSSPAAGARGTELRVFRADPSEFVTIDRRGWTNRFDFEYHERSVHVAGSQTMARISWQPRLAAALWTALDAGGEFLEAFENCFRVLSAYRLLELGGAILHSSCVVSEGVAWVFLGPSGAGKTTIARLALASGRAVLSDDINALRATDSAALVEKMPFAGELGPTNERVGPFPVAALARIEQAARDSWRPLSTAAAVAAVLGCAPFVNGDPYRLPVLMDNLESLVRGIPTGVLEFSLGGAPWPVLEAATA
ncbi:MAG: hypothetical protein OES32_01520 [Acidobacteriota bacterium]|nr:hypothetical protein [Acidobacteriota bacterium]